MAMGMSVSWSKMIGLVVRMWTIHLEVGDVDGAAAQRAHLARRSGARHGEIARAARAAVEVHGGQQLGEHGGVIDQVQEGSVLGAEVLAEGLGGLVDAPVLRLPARGAHLVGVRGWGWG
eukprot:scaffold26920_cov49-Phaeocystis_antarctica.AAC.1